MDSQNGTEKTRAFIIAAAILIVVVVVGVMLRKSLAARTPENAQDYFTIDDGQTLFSADNSKGPSFEKNGQEAVRAVVFSCDGGKTKFVGYLRRRAPGQTTDAAGNLAPHQVMPSDMDMQVKRPGDAKWLTAASREGYQVLSVHCPAGGTTPPVEVSP